MIVVSDTSPLCNLALIDHLWLLEAIYQTVIIPTLVADELAAANNPTIPAILQLDWIQTRSLIDAAIANQLQRDRGLDAGEAKERLISKNPTLQTVRQQTSKNLARLLHPLARLEDEGSDQVRANGRAESDRPHGVT